MTTLKKNFSPERIKLSNELRNKISIAQKNEITEFHIYSKLAKTIKDKKNSSTLQKIATDEQAHYDYWKSLTNTDVKPNSWKIFKFYWIARIFGLTFGIKLMENGEKGAQKAYSHLAESIPGADKIMHDEDRHEKSLIAMIEEERLQYVGSVVLGLNDALVEFTGALAGVTFALQNSKLVALTGLITGIAAAFSMAASEYLSTKADALDSVGESTKNALKASSYTGMAYMFTVFLLVLPYLLLPTAPFIALAIMIAIVVLIIFGFNFYISVAKDYNFKHRFFEMTAISLGVASLSFGVGYLVRIIFGINI